MSAERRPAWVEVDLGAIARNTEFMARLVAPSRLCGVVKADAYGHGAAGVAPVMLAAGASMLAVSLVDEGVELRDAGVTGEVLVLCEPMPEEMADAVARGLTPTIYTAAGLDAVRRAGRALGRRVGVHLKVDTGMHRVGADAAVAVELARSIATCEEVELAGLFSHLAVADVPDDPFTAVQAGRLAAVRAELGRSGIVPPISHLANSAGAIFHPGTRLDMVRSGIAIYGHAPSPTSRAALLRALDGEELAPAFSLRARVHLVRDLEAGERTSYGRRYELPRRARVAVVPLGYHDGVPRVLGEGGADVLIGGFRCPIAGTVTMDQVIVDCGELAVEAGDEVVLVGRQGDEEVTAEEWAARLGSIPHEVFARIGARVPRRYVGG